MDETNKMLETCSDFIHYPNEENKMRAAGITCSSENFIRKTIQSDEQQHENNIDIIIKTKAHCEEHNYNVFHIL